MLMFTYTHTHANEYSYKKNTITLNVGIHKFTYTAKQLHLKLYNSAQVYTCINTYVDRHNTILQVFKYTMQIIPGINLISNLIGVILLSLHILIALSQ